MSWVFEAFLIQQNACKAMNCTDKIFEQGAAWRGFALAMAVAARRPVAAAQRHFSRRCQDMAARLQNLLSVRTHLQALHKAIAASAPRPAPYYLRPFVGTPLRSSRAGMAWFEVRTGALPKCAVRPATAAAACRCRRLPQRWPLPLYFVPLVAPRPHSVLHLP